MIHPVSSSEFIGQHPFADLKELSLNVSGAIRSSISHSKRKEKGDRRIERLTLHTTHTHNKHKTQTQTIQTLIEPGMSPSQFAENDRPIVTTGMIIFHTIMALALALAAEKKWAHKLDEIPETKHFAFICYK